MASFASRCLAVIGVFAIGACAASGTGVEEDPDEPCIGAGCVNKDAGRDSTTPPTGYDSGPVEEEDGGEPEDDAEVIDSAPPTDSGGNWVDMTANASACHGRAGVSCGWSATNNNAGATCACRRGTWAEGWTCEAPTAPTFAGPSCPGVVGDAGADSGPIDSGHTDGGGWVDMNAGGLTACDNRPGVPCGWNPTNTGTGYTCDCRHGTWAQAWTCEPIATPKTPGPACP